MSTPTLPIRDINPKFYSRREVANIIGVDHSTISRWEKKGLITPAQRFNGMCLYTDVELEQIKIIAKQLTEVDPNVNLCSICDKRQARRNSTVCSRCSVKKLKESLRSELPGMDLISSDSAENSISNLDTTEEIQLQPGVKYYHRGEIAELLNIAPSTIARWEEKGATPKPFKSFNQYIYTEEIFNKIVDYAEKQVALQRSPLERAARLSSKSFGKADRAIAARIRGIGRGIL